MKPDEPGFKLAYKYFIEVPGGFTYEEFKNLFGEAIQSAILAEREECAKIAIGIMETWPGININSLDPFQRGQVIAADRIQAAIRSRSQSAPQMIDRSVEGIKTDVQPVTAGGIKFGKPISDASHSSNPPAESILNEKADTLIGQMAETRFSPR